jgi:hypothetical protein
MTIDQQEIDEESRFDGNWVLRKYESLSRTGYAQV